MQRFGSGLELNVHRRRLDDDAAATDPLAAESLALAGPALSPAGNQLYRATIDSGDPAIGVPGSQGNGTYRQNPL